jgi:hypothetical protein
MIALPYYKEEWKNISEYEGLYQVSSFMKVLNVKTGKILKLFKNEKGYLNVNLSKNGDIKMFRVHRLIAQAFVPNPENKPEVDHINTYRDDNRIENLRWVNEDEQHNNILTKEHIRRGETHYLYGKYGKEHPQSKPVLQYDLDDNFIREWENSRQIEKELNIKRPSICNCCNGKHKTAGGYIWKYKK